MKTDVLTRGLFALLATATLFAPAFAQQEPETPRGRYATFAIDPNYESQLKNRLQMEKQLGPLKDLIKQIAADPQKFPVNLDKIKDLKLDDPQFKKAVQDWAAHDQNLQQALRDWIKQNPSDKQADHLKELHKNLESILKQSQSKSTTPSKETLPKITLTPQFKLPIVSKAKEEPFAKMAEQTMKQAEDGKLGDWLRNSPAWQRAFDDLRASMAHPNQKDAHANGWSDLLRLPDEKLLELGQQTMERLRNLPPPDLDRWNLPEKMPDFGAVGMPNLQTPNFPGVGGSLPSFGMGTLWLLFIMLVALTAWQMLSWRKKSIITKEEELALGSWPVRPESVLTRTELVQAFDYLALLTLGKQVQSWNHQAIVQHWCARKPVCTAIATELAALYEKARYTEGAEELPPTQRDHARQALLKLAEAF